jgi:hypothetical protein
VCDHRVEIPRASHRPSLEDLILLANEAEQLPLRPTQLPTLRTIVKQGVDFRSFVGNTLSNWPPENPLDVARFYLRKIEGAEILLRQETNFFRSQVHLLDPLSSESPVVVEESKSTRKPRGRTNLIDNSDEHREVTLSEEPISKYELIQRIEPDTVTDAVMTTDTPQTMAPVYHDHNRNITMI